ncbi:hypothetical protein [Kineococcus rhizosphaerae]|uniref:Uncharacterized protein n=1 Tax=Kineococcus rhizosphaerae TaxID=559628 RepID=A0A2T0R5T0_9ACTN|nr:hypothetical protein [Kineococcus rhizosphaerae]PRY16118.1 hypothetical protein CLV37_104338 [Kineococcus rhizosphaerae]
MTVVKWEDLEVLETGRVSVRVPRRPLAAAALSVLWPGFGHAYLGRTASAVGLAAAMVTLVVLTVLPGAWRFTAPAWGALLVVAAVTAWRAGAPARPAART